MIFGVLSLILLGNSVEYTSAKVNKQPIVGNVSSEGYLTHNFSTEHFAVAVKSKRNSFLSDENRLLSS